MSIYISNPAATIENVSKQGQENQLSTAFIKELELTLSDPDGFQSDHFDVFSLNEIFNYLKLSHDLYLNHWLPKIEQTVDILNLKFGRQYLAIRVLKFFLEKYRNELVQHINQEESVLFVYIEKLLNGEANDKAEQIAVAHFLNTHNDNIVLHLDDLKNDLLLFHTNLKENLVFQVLFNQLHLFQRELAIHGLIEDLVVVPRVIATLHNN